MPCSDFKYQLKFRIENTALIRGKLKEQYVQSLPEKPECLWLYFAVYSRAVIITLIQHISIIFCSLSTFKCLCKVIDLFEGLFHASHRRVYGMSTLFTIIFFFLNHVS